MSRTVTDYYTDKFAQAPLPVDPIHTAHRRLATPIPAPQTLEDLPALRPL